MARRRFQRGRKHRRRTYWEFFSAIAAGESAFAAAAVSDTLLHQIPVVSNDVATLLRIVGNVYMGLQLQQATMRMLSWGIYLGQSGGGGSLRFISDVAADLSEENWLHTRFHAQINPRTEWNRMDTVVDIKVMRKFEGGTELHLTTSCLLAAYVTQINLRGLFMAP